MTTLTKQRNEHDGEEENNVAQDARRTSLQQENTMIRPIAVETRGGYRIWLRYSDGVAGEIDLSHLTGRGVFAAWDDRTFFEAVRLEDHGAVAWGEELELCPDALYMQLVGKSVAEVMPRIRIPVENA